MPEWLAVILLGIIEGLTEFLPVSSTGHLILAEHWLGEKTQMFNVVIQSGAVVAVLAVFFDRARELVLHWRKPENFDYLLKLMVCFGITGAIGLILKKAGMELESDPVPVAWATLMGGVLFLVVEHLLRNHKAEERITWAVAIAVAGAQLLAMAFPGTSRSGAAILAALALGVSRPAAAEFAFLVGIPTLVGAGAKEAWDAHQSGEPHEPWSLILLGCVVAAISAFVVVRWLLGYVRTHRFTGFAIYRIVLGTLILLFATK